ncbi:VWA domain-containing protein [Lentisphaera profundi]|uniref:VWA domain-containing protein n=1 Tax=Lentisphaera profundi TaxID=1658616 RepID=A0ABY7VUF2_9BACT|nr:VWA domain-containing protein [Lentisphaera profundi]WDE96384.1 VWA domain-containing protein [Lentisphaera profundi]
MILLAPEWLILIPAVLIFCWFFFRPVVFRFLRISILLILLFCLTEPHLNQTEKGMDLYVLVDRSDSAESYLEEKIAEWEELLEKEKGNYDRIFYIDYGRDILPRIRKNERELINGSESLSGEAIFKALSLAKSDRHSRILVLSDGFGTDSLNGLSNKLIEQEIFLDYRLLHYSRESDIQVKSLRVPERVMPGEKFVVEALFEGDMNQKFNYTLLRDKVEVDRGVLELQNGRAFLRKSDSLQSGGLHKYEIRISSPADQLAGNNRAEVLLEVKAGPRVVLLSTYKNDPFVSVLRKQGFDLKVFNEFSKLNSATLAGARLVIINNVPAWELPDGFLEELNFFSKDQGGGLIMAGGQFSFGMGGYFKSPIDELLPVSMELKNEHRKRRSHLSIVMDRSGSMAMTVKGGKTKMELANEGAAQTIELLGGMDSVSVIAVDTNAHVIVPQTVLKGSADIISQARRVKSQGGGIYVYTGLEESWRQLEGREGQKHIILFSDAGDSEEPGNYKELLSDMNDEGMTVSVIALGTREDSDAPFLIDIAKRGKGRVFFTNDPMNLPAIFAQETVTVARSAYLKELTLTIPGQEWSKVASGEWQWPAMVNAYNLSYLKEGAKATLRTNDYYKAPLIAWWKVGAGRSVALSFPTAGEYSDLVRQWPQYGDFLQTLTRWAAKPDVPAGLSLRYKKQGSTLSMNFHYDSKWADEFSREMPELYIKSSLDNEVRKFNWRRLLPGVFSSRIDLASGEIVTGVIKAGDHTIPFGPLKSDKNAEWRFDLDKVEQLRDLSKLSGGREINDLSEVWKNKPAARLRDISPYFLILVLILFLLEIYQSRVGKLFKKRVAHQNEVYSALLDDIGLVRSIGTKTKEPDSAALVTEEDDLDKESKLDANERRSRFDRAKM